MNKGTIRAAVASIAITIAALAALFSPGATVVTAGGMDMDPMVSKTGDLNQDGVANSLDALAILFHDAGLTKPPEDLERWTLAADVDCDLEVTALDAALILQADAGLYQLRM